MAAKPWYQAGLRFTCTQCGNCCTGAPGYTWVSDAEITALAARLGIDEAAFRGRYTRSVGSRGTSLTEKANNDCVFYERGVGCTVYQDRPKQCRTWPFWGRIVANRSEWTATASGCPGMDHGKLHDAPAIAAAAADDGLP